MKSEYNPLENSKLQMREGRKDCFLMILEFIRPDETGFAQFDGWPLNKELEDGIHDYKVRFWQKQFELVCLHCGFSLKWVDENLCKSG